MNNFIVSTRNLGRIALIFVGRPKLIEASASNDQCWVDFEPVRSESWVFEKFNELLDVPFQVHIRQIRHHVDDNFVAGVLGHVEAFAHSGHLLVIWLVMNEQSKFDLLWWQFPPPSPLAAPINRFCLMLFLFAFAYGVSSIRVSSHILIG
jgi:hypothetical protein